MPEVKSTSAPMPNIGIKTLLSVLCLVLFFGSSNASACKELLYPAHLGKGTLDTYDVIAVVAIDKVTPLAKDTMYTPPFKFSGKVLRSIKGPYKVGDAIFGQTGGPYQGAGCPIDLAEKRNYLLFFHGTKNPITLARYGSYFRDVGDGNNNQYVKDLDALASH
jgi:hypothetical protein